MGGKPSKKNNEAIAAMGFPMFPFDIVCEEILPRLPVRSLMRFRCVCKPWRSHIDHNKRFVRTHLEKSKESKIIVQQKLSKLEFVNSEGEKIPGMEDITPLTKSFVCFYLADGLICLEAATPSTDFPFRVLNPWTRRKIDLPWPDNLDSYYIWFRYFNRNQSSGACKLFIICLAGSRLQPLIFTLGADKSWRNLGACPELSISAPLPAVLFSSCYCWVEDTIHFIYEVCSKNDPRISYSDHIIGFDMCQETFRPMKYPPVQLGPNFIAGDSRRTYSISIGSVGECLHLLYMNCTRSTIDVWKLKDYAKQVWAKDYSFCCRSLTKELQCDCRSILLNVDSNRKSKSVQARFSRLRLATLYCVGDCSGPRDCKIKHKKLDPDDYNWAPCEESLVCWE